MLRAPVSSMDCIFISDLLGCVINEILDALMPDILLAFLREDEGNITDETAELFEPFQ